MKTLNTLRIFAATTIAAALLFAAATTTQAVPDTKYKSMPGYVDIHNLGEFDDLDASVEVFLKGSLLKLAREAVRYEEPELALILDNIHMVRVNVFPIDEDKDDAVAAKAKTLAKQLEAKGWEVAVRVREKDEDVYVYILPNENDEGIEGLVVMVAERSSRHSDGEFTFVNIVGNINPEDIGRLGRSMNINGLNIDGYYLSDEDRDRERAERDAYDKEKEAQKKQKNRTNNRDDD